MADLNPALDRLLGIERGYANDPDDSGGETYAGITRRDFPGWPGWAAVDRAKPLTHGARVPGADPHVEAFYREHFWGKLGCDAIPSQAIAHELFEFAVNAGIATAVTVLQRALNVLNKRATLYPDIAVDGRMGLGTVGALLKLLGTPMQAPSLLAAMNVLQGAHYIELAERREKDERFIRGWLRRVEIHWE